ncbi:MAG: LamG-like jellyroll fold domain-containing protein [Verrucomicrobiota bacterium]
MKKAALHELIDALLDGDCSEADFLRLEAELHVDPLARRVYYDRLKLHTALQQEAQGHPESSPRLAKKFQWNRALPWFAGMAALLLLSTVGVVGWQLGRGGTSSSVAGKEPLAAGFGVLAEQSNASWENHPLSRGDLLPQGTLELTSGIAELELFSGVTVTLEGKARFEVHSAMEMTVHEGRLQAVVPEPARGFRVRTASGDVVDLGTEFAIAVTPEHADLQVLKGEIEWHPLSQPVHRLVDGEALRWTADGQPGSPPESLNLFSGDPDFAASRARKQEAWQAHSDRLRQDPRLLAYFPMDQPIDDQRRLSDASGAAHHGTIVRASPVTDRWEQPGKALDFSPTGSRVRLTIPGEHAHLTFHCWVRIDSLDRWYNSLFLTDGHELQEPHWQIMDDGRLFFSVKKRNATKKDEDKHIAYSPPIWTPALSGKWMQIATVYDSAARTTTHYVNGKQVSQERLPDDMVVEKVRIGAASIGNWSEPKRQDPYFAVRNLNGAIDEFAIFAAALRPGEIAELYNQGRP